MLIQGKARWAKVVGEPGWGYEKAFKEWSIDVYIDEATEKKLKNEGLGSKIKDKGNGPYISFKRKEIGTDRNTGQPKKNEPIRIVDHKGQPWDNRKIGNDSTVNVNFAINEYKPGQKNANILALQVWDYVPFEGGEFSVKEDDGDDWSQEVA